MRRTQATARVSVKYRAVLWVLRIISASDLLWAMTGSRVGGWERWRSGNDADRVAVVEERRAERHHPVAGGNALADHDPVTDELGELHRPQGDPCSAVG